MKQTEFYNFILVRKIIMIPNTISVFNNSNAEDPGQFNCPRLGLRYVLPPCRSVLCPRMMGSLAFLAPSTVPRPISSCALIEWGSPQR